MQSKDGRVQEEVRVVQVLASLRDEAHELDGASMGLLWRTHFEQVIGIVAFLDDIINESRGQLFIQQADGVQASHN